MDICKNEMASIHSMKKIVLFTLLVSGCSAYVTEENSSDFDTWELCTLLHNPESLYSSWVPLEEENEVIRAELEKRGYISKEDCSIESIAKSKCVNLGFKEGTSDYAQCHLDVELHIAEMKQIKKSARETEEAAQSSAVNAAILSRQRNNSTPRVPPPTFEPVWKP